MTDLLVVLVTLAFFGLCAGYVRLCDGVIGPDDLGVSGTQTAPDATAPTRADGVAAMERAA